MRIRKQLLFGALLAACALVLSGCVYLRLLQLKWQLAEFDQNFAVDTSDGVILTFRKPVLLSDDVESFFKWIPDERRRMGAAEQWRFRWIKAATADDGNRPPTELSVDLKFADGKLVTLSAPETFFAATMPKALALAALRSLGGASVDQKSRRAESQIASTDLQAAAAEPFLTKSGLLATLGAPNTRTEKENVEEWRYEFVPASSRQRFGDSGVVDIVFRLDPTSGRVRLMKGRTVFGSIAFDTTNIGESATGQMHAALPE